MEKISHKIVISPQMIKLGRYLKSLRKELGFSIYETAKRTKLSPGYISKIETGNSIKTINVDALVMFSKIYNIPIEVVLEKAGYLSKKTTQDLPGLSIYLKIKYGASHQAIRDMEIAWEIIKKKYKI